MKGFMSVCAIVALVACLSPTMADESKSMTAVAEGFRATYEVKETPESEWGSEKEGDWIAALSGSLTTEKEISYRGRVLPIGMHDLWAEKGKSDWYYLYVGDRDDPEKPRLRAMFKLYEEEDGVSTLEFGLKLTRKGTKLKFSVRAGRSEGHGNFAIVDDETSGEDPDQ